ncbi:MAG: transcription termination/antitermination NusG family protein [Chromatocurvus sp.]
MTEMFSNESGAETWYAVATHARHEETARLNLERQDYRVYLPRTAIRKRRGSRWTRVVEPLFPGYLFLQVNPLLQDITPVRSTRGAHGIVKTGAHYIPLPNHLIRALQTMEGQLLDQDVATSVPFKQGDRVRFVGGSFEGIEGVFEMARGSDRVSVLITLLGQQRSVSTQLDEIAPR